MSDNLRFALSAYRNNALGENNTSDGMSAAMNALGGMGRAPTYMQPQYDENDPSWLARVGQGAASAGMWGLRGIASLLEPIQLPKDVLDAIVVGWADDNSTVSERLGRVEWLKYAPLGAAPQRPASGREFAEALGMSGRSAVATGFVWDILGDPLLVGGAVSGIGKIARGLGAVDMGTELIRTGVRIDRALSPITVAKGVNSAFRSVPGMARAEDYMMGLFGGFMDARLFWERGPEARTYGDMLMKQSDALSRQLPDTVPGTLDNMPFGKRLFIGEGQGQQMGRDVEVQLMAMLDDANKVLLGEAALPWLQRAARNISRAMRKADDPTMARLPQVVLDTIHRQAFDVIDEIGIGTRRSVSITAPPQLSATVEGVPLVAGTANRTAAQTTLLKEARQRVADVARRNKVDPAEAVRRFDYFRDRVQEADALAGYYASGYEPILMRWLENLTVHAGIQPADGMRLFAGVRRQAMDGVEFKSITQLEDAQGVLTDIENLVPGWRTPGGDQVKTMADMVEGMGGETGFYGLNLEKYLFNLQGGHMQRVYSMFQNAGDYDGFIRQMEAGKVIPGNILDAKNLPEMLPPGYTREARLLRSYVASLEVGSYRTPVGGASPRGLLVRQEDLANHLLDRGIAPDRVRETIGHLISSLSGHPQMHSAIARVEHIIASNKRTRGLTQAAGSGGTTVWGTRNRELEKQMLDEMGELVNPLPSIAAQAREVRQRLPWARYMSQAYDEGTAAGYVREGRYTDHATGTRYVSVPEDPQIWGSFAGKWVHPFLQKEMERLLRARTENRGSGFARLKSLITGGYLASPNVIAANILGGVHTTALAGVSPDEFMPAIISSWREFQKASKDPTYVFQALDDLKRFVAINRTTLVDASIEKSITALQGVVNAQDVSKMRQAFNGMVQAAQGMLDAPLGQKWAGLDGFQFVENLMKVSAFTARRQRLAIERGVDLAEFTRPVAERSIKALQLEAEAAELARIAVFDYSDLPGLVRSLRDKGLMLFPGFSYFIMGRTLDAALRRPGVLASSDRIAGAVAGLDMDEDEKLALYASMPEWLAQEQGVPMPFMSYTAEDGSRRHSVIPFNQLVPTNISPAGTNMFESLAFGGIYRPLLEMLAANFTGSGEAPFSAKYGSRVFSRGATGLERIGQSAGYLFSSLMPGILRKTVGSFHPDRGVTGGLATTDLGVGRAVRGALGMSVPIPEGLGDTLYSMTEIQTQRADKRFGDLMLSMFLRSPQVVTTGGGLLASVRSVVEQSRQEMLDEVARLRSKARKALQHGNRELAQQYYREIGQRQRLWAEEIMPRYQATSVR